MGSNTEPALFSSSRPWCSEDLCLQDTVFGAFLLNLVPYLPSASPCHPQNSIPSCIKQEHKHSDHPPFKPRFYEGRQVSKDIHQWGWEETLKGNTLWKICRPKNDIFLKPEDVNIYILWIKSQKPDDKHFARTICGLVYSINVFDTQQSHDDVRGDAHHFWGWAKWNRWGPLIACQRRGWRARGCNGRGRLWRKGAPRWRRRRRQHGEPGVLDGQHADREREAPGEPKGDTGEPGNGSAPPPGAGTREGVTSEAAVYCPATGMHHSPTLMEQPVWKTFGWWRKMLLSASVFLIAKANQTESLCSVSSCGETLPREGANAPGFFHQCRKLSFIFSFLSCICIFSVNQVFFNLVIPL